MLKPTGYSNEEWKQHFIIENKQKVGENKSFNLKELQFYGKCSDPAIYRKFLGYIDYLGAELKRCIEYSEGFEYKEYLIKLLPTPNLNINTIGFSFADFKLNLDYTAVTNLLMGENIYGDKKYGLREILQNSIDACKVYEEYHQRKLNEYDSYLPIIKIKVDEENKEIRIFDNGNGMTLDILKNYFLNIGVSYYKSKEYKFKNYGYSPIGNFGIGFLACFMLSEDVTLFTKTSTEKIGNVVKINRNSEYICFSNENLKFNHGTEIILNYDDFFKAFNDIETIETFIKNNFIDNDIPIEIIDSTKKNTLKLFKLEELLNPPINLSKDKTLKPNQPISLSNYFEDIDVLVYMRFSKSCFVETLKDLSNNNSYYYKDSDGKIYLEDRCTLKEYVENNEINYLEVAIVDDYNSTEFGTAYEYLEDYELALNKIDPEWISILYKKDQNVECGDIYFDNIVVGDYLYDNLVHDFNQSVTVPAYILNLKQKVIDGKGRKILTYVQQIRNANKNIHRNNIFCKGVLVKEAAVNIPFTLNDFYLKDIAINSKNQKIIPDVTRNSFSSEIKEELSYAVGKAVHMWILDNADLDYEEKNLLQEFVKLNYSKDSIFLKK